MIIIDFAGLKPKMYSYRTESKNNKTAKGVKKNVIKKDINHSNRYIPNEKDFLIMINCLNGECVIAHFQIESDWEHLKILKEKLKIPWLQIMLNV